MCFSPGKKVLLGFQFLESLISRYNQVILIWSKIRHTPGCQIVFFANNSSSRSRWSMNRMQSGTDNRSPCSHRFRSGARSHNIIHYLFRGRKLFLHIWTLGNNYQITMHTPTGFEVPESNHCELYRDYLRIWWVNWSGDMNVVQAFSPSILLAKPPKNKQTNPDPW